MHKKSFAWGLLLGLMLTVLALYLQNQSMARREKSLLQQQALARAQAAPDAVRDQAPQAELQHLPEAQAPQDHLRYRIADPKTGEPRELSEKEFSRYYILPKEQPGMPTSVAPSPYGMEPGFSQPVPPDWYRHEFNGGHYYIRPLG